MVAASGNGNNLLRGLNALYIRANLMNHFVACRMKFGLATTEPMGFTALSGGVVVIGYEGTSVFRHLQGALYLSIADELLDSPFKGRCVGRLRINHSIPPFKGHCIF